MRWRYSNNFFVNFLHLLRIFFIRPAHATPLQLTWGRQVLETSSGADGFFRFEWVSEEPVPAGWHEVRVYVKGDESIAATAKLFVPHITQHAFISDIDDTVLVSHSGTVLKRLKLLFTKNPKSRRAFSNVVKHYQLLAYSNTEPEVPNPFFYVSSSEWNLYNDLTDFFRFNQLPQGVFLLNDIKRWYQLLKTGKTRHQGKLLRMARILAVYPLQRFVLLGDNSQEDPQLYALLAARHANRVVAVFIRNVNPQKKAATETALKEIAAQDIYTCFFEDDDEAIDFSRTINLIDDKHSTELLHLNTP